MHKIFHKIHQTIDKNKLLSTVLAFSILILCGFFISKLNFEEDISQIIPRNEKSDLTAKVLQQLSFSDKIVVIIENKSQNTGYELSETADVFLEKIHPLENDYINNIQGKVNDNQMSETYNFVFQNLPVFLEESDYAEIENQISKDSISKKIQDNYNALVSPTSLVMKDFIKKDPLGFSFLGLKKLNSLNMSEGFTLENNYLVSQDGKSLLLFIEPKFGGSETKNNEIFVGKLNQIKDEINKKFSGSTEISYFGAPMIAVANAHQIKKDIQSTVTISVTILLLLLIIYFRKVFTPVIIFIPSIFAVAIALVFLYFLKDQISAISISIGAILLGISVDYSLHILTHFKHNNDAKSLYKNLTKPILMSSVTTAVSFLCLVFVRSEALKDLGIFASVSVLLSSIFALILIPHLYHPKENSTLTKNTILDKIGNYDFEKNKIFLIICGVILFASLFGFQKVQFNQNIAELNFVPEEMKTSEAKLEKLSHLTSKSIYAISYGNTEEEVLEKNEKLFHYLSQKRAENKILSFNSIGQIVLSEKKQQEKINRWNSFWTKEKRQFVLDELVKNGQKLGFKNSAFDEFSLQINQDYEPLKLSDYKNLEALQLSEFLKEDNRFYTLSTLVKLDEKNRDQILSELETNNEILAIDRQQMNENFLGLLKEDFLRLINYSLITIFIILFVFFKRIELALLAMTPIVLTGIVTGGLLYFLGLQLNIFSTIVCTLVFGVGVDFSIFLTKALQKEYTTGEKVLPTYRVSIILAVLTTILSIGTLIFAKHPALHSVASVALIGMFSVLMITFILYPFLFRRLIMKRPEKGVSPVSLRLFLHSTLSFFYYGLGGLIFSFFGQFFVPKAKGNFLLNVKKIIAGFLTSVLYSNPFVKKKVINKSNEVFDKPAIIIANHTSFLDILVIAMTTPKAIYLVNDWVYNSPIFGRLVRAIGFFPVSQGIENGVSKLKEKVDEGYSLMVFPEASRSIDNKVKRFHKGAFFLAEELNLDIVPVYIHGNSEVLPKNDHIIYDGAITVVVGKRLDINDSSLGKSYSEKTKKINAFFREKFDKIRADLENENYFKKILFLSFLYKENEVVNAVKQDFEEHKNAYFDLNKFIGKNEVILHISNDYGQKDVLLTLQEAGRRVFSFNKTEEKRNIAKRNYLLKRRKILYIDHLNGINKKIDVLLISDENTDFEKININVAKIIFFKVDPPKSILTNYSLLFENESVAFYELKK